MTFSALYVLPALAILILIYELWASAQARDTYRSRKHTHRSGKRQQHVRHRALFFRSLIVALIAATALTWTWPLPLLLEIMQGAMITVAIMIPICVYIVISKLWPQPSYDEQSTQETHISSADTPDLRPAHLSEHLPADVISASHEHGEGQQSEKQTVQQPEALSGQSHEPLRDLLEKSLDELLREPLKASHTDSPEDILKAEQVGLSQDPWTNTEYSTSEVTETDALKSQHSQSHKQESAPEQESALDQTLSVSKQMETLDDLVDFHDIGEHNDQAQVTGPDAQPAYNPLEKAIAVARHAILEEPGIQDYSSENLPAKSRIELSEMVVRLRNDKMKLQKLVIAQKSVIDSEKQAHERTRVVVKDAISVMRHARHGQRIAEKIARRERAERQRLEKDYVKVRRALDNALSTLKAKSERADVEEV